MKTDNVIKLGINDALEPLHFVRKVNTWYRDTEEAVVVVELQKSNFGEQYYVNLGVVVKGLAENQVDKLPPRENQCHVRVRLEALATNEEEVKTLLNFEDEGFGLLERRKGVMEAISRTAVPFLEQCRTQDGIRNAEREGRLRGALMHKCIRDLLPVR